MTNEQILKKAIEKAVGNGYKKILGDAWLEENQADCNRNYFILIFSHNFAKSFFKEYETHSTFEQYEPSKTYLNFLSEMVREKEPLKYLEKFLQ